MRRRKGPEPAAPPERLARFRLADWYDPTLDGRPAAWVPYGTAEDRFVHHAARAASRHTQAKRDAGVPL